MPQETAAVKSILWKSVMTLISRIMYCQSIALSAKELSISVNSLLVNESRKISFLWKKRLGPSVRGRFKKHDEQLLLHIRGKDLVAIKVRYHKSCYYRFTKVVKGSNDYEQDTRQTKRSIFSQEKTCPILDARPRVLCQLAVYVYAYMYVMLCIHI